MGGREVGAASETDFLLMLSKGMWRRAVLGARRAVEADPDNAEAFAALGIAGSRATFFADAVAAFEFAESSQRYWTQGLGAHADALRYTGHGQEAAELRDLLLLDSSTSADARLTVMLGQVDDLRSVGDYEGAHSAAMAALSYRPNSPAVHAFLADLYLDLWEVDEAAFHLWQARDAQENLRYWLVEARFSIYEGNLMAARRATDKALEMRRRSARVVALNAQVMRLEGLLDDAELVLNRDLVKLQEHPALQAARILVAHDRGQDVEARDLARLGMATYPGHVGVLRAAEMVLGKDQVRLGDAAFEPVLVGQD